MSDSIQRDSQAAPLMKKASLFSMSTAFILILLKAVGYTLTASTSLLSSLLDSCADLLASSINYFSIRFSLLPKDREHRYGHGKIEALGSLLQAAFIAGSAIFVIISIVDQIMHSKKINQEYIGITICLIAILLTFLLTHFQKNVIKKAKSLSIEADFLHYKGDLLSNASVILGLILTKYTDIIFFDSFFAVLIVFYLLLGAYKITKKSLKMLLDEEFGQEERERISRIILEHRKIYGLHDLRTRRSGITEFIQVDIELAPDISLKSAHTISDEVEKNLLTHYPHAEIMIHQDTIGPKEEHHDDFSYEWTKERKGENED